MEWTKDYQLFLFDFDGLLVNTEEIHYQAYKKMCRDRGFELPWDFSRYCQVAHYHQETLRRELMQSVPGLERMESDWEVLYQEKKQAMVELLSKGSVTMMPGAEKLLRVLDQEGIERCVVTHSPLEQIELIKQGNPILFSIPHWFTRESYTKAKPDPECYLNAIEKLCPEEGKVIGFEDTPRGMQALMETPAEAVMITQVNYPEQETFVSRGAKLFNSLADWIHSRS
ncbi:HAD family hydrolase [Waddlia chondrophila]|uniref:HAD-superfamily hydrolase n=1 Tax=Waddlia chondrophila (strain ATCC VR-1470 / WSU 86-1044) TaxID=716544 RepID=D6YUD4_WADCW|nr:HAD family phosphatase [Waddlia chondrophila]ADI37745.1 HAD-superfamily hydrolase [Waddlia chondrophila WSU 86-1044]